MHIVIGYMCVSVCLYTHTHPWPTKNNCYCATEYSVILMRCIHHWIDGSSIFLLKICSLQNLVKKDATLERFITFLLMNHVSGIACYIFN